ncbi:hypothetical protein [Methylocystis bryophila]|nr:hypothetical protein [Methylocystis bryophila]
MQRRRLILSLFYLLAPQGAQAAGVTSITPNPSPGIACKLNTIKIAGAGTCSGVQFNLGDGTNIVNLPGTFPLLVYHTYRSAGSYPLTAQGEGQCAGAVHASLQVIGPTITSVFPFSVIKPGGSIILQGENFGSLPGQIVIRFQGQLIGTNLENIQWGDAFAAGTIPQGISGQPDQRASIYVVASCGAVSNSITAQFTASRDLVALPFDDIGCSSTATLGNSDACQKNGSYGTPLECALSPTFGLEPGPTGFQGYHASGWGFSGEAGNDQFSGPSLKNGWGFASASSFSGDYIGTFYQPTYWFQSSVGDANPKVSVNWQADNCGLIFYYADIYISGPTGVPYQ